MFSIQLASSYELQSSSIAQLTIETEYSSSLLESSFYNLFERNSISPLNMDGISIIEDIFGRVNDPITGAAKDIRRFTFSNDNGVCVQVITYGATITSIRCPDKYGNIADIALGFDDIQGICE